MTEQVNTAIKDILTSLFQVTMYLLIIGIIVKYFISGDVEDIRIEVILGLGGIFLIEAELTAIHRTLKKMIEGG